MAPELERPRVTEIQVRMDCNGCVQKIKKALHGVNGIYELYIDVPQQKLTIVGWADPQKIVKAIRKTRKTAVICSHSEPPSESPPEQPTDGVESPPDDESDQSNPPPQEAEGPPETSPPPQAEPPKEPSPAENPQPEEKQSPPPPPPEPEPNSSSQQPPQPAGSNPPGQKDVGEVHVIYHHPPSDYRYPPPSDYGYRYNGYGGGSPSSSSSSGYHYWDRYHDGPGYPPVIPRPPPSPQPPPPPVYVAHHNYNTYRPAPYVTEYEYVRSTQPPPPPPQPRYMPPPPTPQPSRYTNYGRMDYYNEEYHDYNQRGNGNVSSMFSDENPNACTVM